MSAERSGTLVQWNDARGFGFVRADDGERFFVHVSDIGRIATRPRVGDAVRFTGRLGRDGRAVASKVVIRGANPADPAVARRGAPQPEAELRDYFRIGGAVLLLVLLLAALMLDRAPLWLAGVYLGLGLLSGLAYLADKRAAQAGRWRVSELKLHGTDLAGGIAGGLLAQQLLRHKTAKTAFAVTTAAIWLLHVGLLSALLSGGIRLGQLAALLN